MRDCVHGRPRRGEDARVVDPFVAFAAMARIQDLQKLGFNDMQLVWVDANDGSVDVMQLFHLEHVGARADDIVVKLVPPRCGSELGSGKMSDGTEVKAVDD